MPIVDSSAIGRKYGDEIHKIKASPTPSRCQCLNDDTLFLYKIFGQCGFVFLAQLLTLNFYIISHLLDLILIISSIKF